MQNTDTEKKPKSTILLLLAIFFLVYAGLIFRAGINTLFFVTDSSVDYAPIQATVTELQADPAVQEKEQPLIIPVFSFHYQDREMTLQAPRLAFNKATDNPPFKTGQQYNLWVHKYQGELILPRRAPSRK